MTSDLDLARRMAAGDLAAVEQLHRLHGKALERFCSRLLGDPEEGADAAQETWLRALQRLRRGGADVQSMRPWLFAIARNQCADRAVARRGAADALEDPDALVSGAAGPHDALEARQDLHELLDDLATLSGAQRSALVLREVGGLDVQDVAAELGARPDRVQWLVSDARQALSERRAGRALPCGQVRRDVLARRRRDRRLSAHLEACDPCQGYLRRERARTLHTRALAPLILLVHWVRGLAGRGASVLPGAADPAAAGALGRPLAALAAGVVAAAGLAAQPDVGPGGPPERPARGAAIAAAPPPPAPAVRAAAPARPAETGVPRRSRRPVDARGPRGTGRPATSPHRAAAVRVAAPAPAPAPQEGSPARPASPAPSQVPVRRAVREAAEPVRELGRRLDTTVRRTVEPVEAVVREVVRGVAPLEGRIASAVTGAGELLRAPARPSAEG